MGRTALRDRLSQARWPVLLAIALTLYSAFLLYYVDASARERLADTNAWLIGDSQRRAKAVADLLTELHSAAASHADLSEVRAYLANRDLGMSPLYGLNAARGAIEARMQQKADDFARRWGVAKPRLIQYSADHAVLVDTAPDAGPPPPPTLPEHPQGLRIDIDKGTLAHYIPILHKGQADGMVVTISALDSLYRNLLQAPTGAAAGHRELLLSLQGHLPPGHGQDLRLQAPQLAALVRAEDDRVFDLADQLDTAAPEALLGDTVMIKTRVPNAPLLLVTFMPRQLAYGHLHSRLMILGAGTLLVVLVAGAVMLDRTRRQAARLAQDVATAELQRTQTEDRNRELTREIERRTAVERALADSEQRWQLAVAGTNDGIWDWNIATAELFMSDRWLEMLGYGHDELPARLETWRDLLHPDDLPATMERLNGHLAGDTAFYQAEFRMRSRSGQYRWILARGKAQLNDSGQPVRMTGSHTDVTERHDSEAQLRDHTEQLNAIFELSPDGFVSFDSHRRVRFVNGAFEAMTGLDGKALLGLDEEAFSLQLRLKGPSDKGFASVGALRDDRAAGDTPSAPTRHTFELLGPPARILEVGLQVATAANVSQVLYLRDITRDTEVDRMKSEFLSTAAHELRTPMTSIYGFVSLLRARQMDEQKRRGMLDTVLRQSELMMSIINQLLDLARIEARRDGEFVFEGLNLQELVGALVADFRPPSDRPVPVLRNDLPMLRVSVDRQKLQQAVLNVLSNAYKYSPAGGEVTLSYRTEQTNSGGQRHGVSICDQGIGMTEQELARCGERFYRADASGHIPGTGLGMSIVKEILDRHGGEVQITSTPGHGTEVTLWLSAA